MKQIFKTLEGRIRNLFQCIMHEQRSIHHKAKQIEPERIMPAQPDDILAQPNIHKHMQIHP